ncbi:hypothetical protein AS850_01850 [Frondihabitans sp. 762G35]|uniref:hypothetical protein n=1 Tax=Frondihabitans sp. 762G35 TaxID=1446794 RepID=UPI000D2187E6|nr:hypothetical protein [Frondihabitans sp. 762G35]ARC55821.1 hypothetical protein AS850_01850 [Frondihabitans sp. 762G35]
MSDEKTPYADDDAETRFAESEQIATNDAVAGETVEPGVGEGNDGPTGGAPREGSPEYAENDLEGDDVDLDETP